MVVDGFFGSGMRTQINIRLTAELLRRIDAHLVGDGACFRSRSDLVRHAVLLYLDGLLDGVRRERVAGGSCGEEARVERAVSDGGVVPRGVGIDTSKIDDGFLEDFG